jgi:hypothetical protein
MGLVMDLRVANWVAHLIQPESPVPRLSNPWEEREALQYFLYKMAEGFVSSPERITEMKRLAEDARQKLNEATPPDPGELLKDLRQFMGGRPWTVLLVPSGQSETDRVICSQELLQRLVALKPGCPGLILQPAEGSYNGMLTLTDVFWAFKTAVECLEDWPGMLVWTLRDQAAFLPFPSEMREDIEKSSIWVLSRLGANLNTDVDILSSEYRREFPASQRSRSQSLKILHLSDMHLGSDAAEERLPRVHELIRAAVRKMSDGSRILPLVTGDLIDTTNEKNVNKVRLFMDFLANLNTEPPISLLGNHDVREDGYLSDNFRQVMRLPAVPAGVEWFDDQRVGLVCFNSVMGGKIARGLIGEAQFGDIGSAIDRKRNSEAYTLIGALHHHPISVATPEWYQQPFYERIFGRFFEKTEALEDSNQFLQFVQARRMAAVLHGHKHIPRIESTWNPSIPIYGCGSTVGKIAAKDGGAYMSMNVITVNTSRGRVSGRLLVERILGGQPEEFGHHEMIFSTRPEV